MANHVPRQEQLDDQKILEETETTKDISLMKELTKLYQQRIEDLNSLNQDGSSNELKIQVLETAIRDLGDLNVMLVDTVNQLEREAVKHVKIFERHLLKSSSAAERYMSQIETINSVAKETARDLRRSKEEELCVQSQLDGATALNMLQVEEISDLKKDLNNLIELLRRVRKEGSWKVDDLEFNTVSLLEILGTNTLPVPEKSSHTEFPSSQPTFSTAVPEQNVFGYENLHIDQLTAELVTLRCAQEEAAMFASVREEEIHQLNEEIAILKEEMVMKDDELEILKRQFGESFSDYENLPSSSNTDTFQFSTIDDSEVKHESSVWKDRALALESEILQVQFEIKKGKEETLELEHQMNLLKIQMEELQEKLLSITKERDSSIAELETNKKELDYSTKEINALKQELKEMDSSSRDVRAALTAEVAEKHDKILVLKRENQIIEEQLREASMQTHFKDDILKEMRKDLKILRARLLSVDPASEEFVSNGLRYISKSSSLPMHLEETVKDDKITQCLSEDFPAVNEPRKETVLEKPSSSADVTLSADSRKNSYKSNLTPEKLKTSRLLASGNQNFTTHPHKPQTNHNYGGMGDIPTNNNVSSTKDVFSYSGGESKVRLRQKELPQCESQDLQVSLLTRQLQHCEDHISAQEELIKHLEEQLKKSKEEYEKVLTSTNSKRRLSLDDSLRCSEDEIEDLEKSFIDKQVEMSESLQQFQKLSHQNNESWNFRETGTELHHNITEEKRDLVSQIEHAKEMEQKYNDLLGEKQKLLIELEKLKLNETDDEFKISKDESWRLSSEVTSLKNQLIMVKDSLSNKEKIISNMDETIRVLRDSFNVQTQEVTNLHFKIGIMGAENQEYEKQIKVMEDEMSNLRHQLEKEKEEKSRVLNDLSQNKKEMENQQIVMDSLKQALMTTKQQLENLEGKGFDVNSSIGEEDRQSQLNTIEYWRKYCSCLFEIVKQQSVLFNIKCDLTDAHTCVYSVEPQTPYLPNSTKKISTADATLVHERMCELEALRVQIEDQTHVIQQLQWDSTKIKESHLSLTKMYQDRCTNLNMLKDKHKHLKKKCEEFEKENEMARSKLQNNAESVCALEEKVKFLSNENNLLKSDVTYLQEEITALSNTNIALANDLSLVQKDNKMMLDTLSDKQNTIEALETNEVDIYNKLMEVSSMKNKVEVDLDNLKSLHAIQIEVNRQHEDRNIDLQHQIKQLTEDSLAARKLYEEAKGLEIQHMKVLNKNLHLEKEILNVKNQYEKQALDNNKQIFDLQQELNNSQNTLKDMTQRIEQLHLHIKEKESEIQQMEMKIGDVLSMESEIQHLSQRIQKLNSELSVKGSEYVRLVSRNSVLSSKLNDTESKVSTLQQVILDKEDEFSKQLEERHGEEAKLKSTIESLKFEILQLKEELHLESVKFLGVKSKIEELQRELMKKASTEMTLQRSLTTAELTLVREKEKVEIKNSENSRLKYELFHLKSVIAKWEHELPTVFTQGPEHDITTEDFLSLRREMAKLKDEVNRLTAIYDNNNIEVRNYLGNWWWDDFLQMN